MSYIDELRKKRQSENNDSYNMGDYTGDSTNVYDDAISKALREGNYKQFYNKAIQNYNLQELAKRNLNNSLQSRGLISSGEGSTAAINISNQYANNYMQSLSDYYNTENAITQDALVRKETADQEEANRLAYEDATLLQYIQSDPTNANSYLISAGYMDDSGNYTEKYYNLPESRRYQFDLALKSVENSTGMTVDNFLAQTVYTDGKSKAISDAFKDQIKDMQKYISDNGGDVAFSLKNNKGDATVYVLYKGGKYYLITADQFNNYGGDTLYIV